MYIWYGYVLEQHFLARYVEVEENVLLAIRVLG